MAIQYIHRPPFGWFPQREDGAVLSWDAPDPLYASDDPTEWRWIPADEYMCPGGLYGWSSEAYARAAFQKWETR